MATYENKPVAFIAVLHYPHNKYRNMKKVSRLVVLPDYQGVGIGKALLNFTAKYYTERGYIFTITTSNPALIHSLKKDENWKLVHLGRVTPNTGLKQLNKTSARRRLTTSWMYRPWGEEQN